MFHSRTAVDKVRNGGSPKHEVGKLEVGHSAVAKGVPCPPGVGQNLAALRLGIRLDQKAL